MLADAALPAEKAWFAADKVPLLVALAVVVAAVLGSIALARAGRPIRIRRLAGLDAVEERLQLLENAAGEAASLLAKVEVLSECADL